MKVLVIGGGGREHALVWTLARSAVVEQIEVAPGNGGTASLSTRSGSRIRNIDTPADDVDALVAYARDNAVDVTVVGPEVPLVAGLADAFAEAELRCFGPRQAAARLEGSKAFAKAFMGRHGIPTARYAIFRDHADAVAHLDGVDYDVVIKASGLAAGKGVLLPDDPAAARVALDQIMIERAYGEAGDVVVIEERLRGPEASVLAFCDGDTVALMPPAQDHKRLLDGDGGPNTGGMGAYAPAPLVGAELLERVRSEILQPTVDAMAAEGCPYVGVLYAGLMLTAAGPKVLEFNCRLGDPEAQVLLPLLETDLIEVIHACLSRRLRKLELSWRPGAAATVVAAAGGYPGSYQKGDPIHGVDALATGGDLTVFHAGTRREREILVTSGGRVLAVTALGDDLEAAIKRAYEGIGQIEYVGMHYRRDIGAQAL